jgi:hypothetical protein
LISDHTVEKRIRKKDVGFGHIILGFEFGL